KFRLENEHFATFSYVLRFFRILYEFFVTNTIFCCTSVSKARIRYPIISHKEQPAANLCVKAVIFRTTSHGSFCSDPKAKWVRKKVENLKSGESTAPQKPKKKGRKNQKKRKPKQPRPVSIKSGINYVY
uniref:Chemokine interleukin-8-like domain-containing protein n=1 Tax=Xenopus tropicalis TaxID=8364 RepID=A0A803JI57_XENTR